MLTSLERLSPWAIGVFRIVVGFLFFCHGTSTLFAWPVAPYSGQTADFGAWPSWWAAAIQFVGGLLIMLGVGTRVAALIGSGSMAVAYFWKHQATVCCPSRTRRLGSAVLLGIAAARLRRRRPARTGIGVVAQGFCVGRGRSGRAGLRRFAW